MNKTSLFTSLIVIIVLTLAPAIFIGLLEDISLYFSICSYIMLMFMVVFFLMYFIDEKEKAKQIKIKNEEKNKINKYLKINLDDKEVWLVDYENCPYLPKCLSENSSENIACYVFANQTQNERLKKELRNLSTKAFIDMIWTSQKGKNLIDIELSYYTGMINSMYTPTSIYIQSNDRGYESLIKASEDLGIFNIKSFRPLNEVLVVDSKCKSIYRQISNETFTNDISLGNFKKKIKKKVLNISADEVNYIVQHLQDTGYISIKENKDGKIVIFEKNKGVK